VDVLQGGVGVGHGVLVGVGMQLREHPPLQLFQLLPFQVLPHPFPLPPFPLPPPQFDPHPPPSFLPRPVTCWTLATWLACSPSVIAFAAVPVRSSVAPTAAQPDITRIRVLIPLLCYNCAR
jgi:hypothetical protein